MANHKPEENRHPTLFRWTHIAFVSSILLLVLTGFYIHMPFVGGGGFFMSLTRGVHFFLAGVLIISAVVRIPSMFIGRNRDWKAFLPTFYDFKLFPKIIKYYTYLGPEAKTKKKYNPMQMCSYCAVFVLIIFQIVSGLALLHPDGGMAWFTFGIFGNEINVRIAHYIVNWAFVLFILIHAYLALREDPIEIENMYLLGKTEEEARKK
jgi:Ni/Fe-hydrogenase 1 B-type cytochrome subunit